MKSRFFYNNKKLDGINHSCVFNRCVPCGETHCDMDRRLKIPHLGFLYENDKIGLLYKGFELQCNTIQYNIIRYNTIKHNTDTIQYNTIQHSTI